MKKLKIVFADNDPEIREVWGNFLKQKGHEVILAQNGEEVYLAVTTDHIDGAIVDYRMCFPGDGLATLELAKSMSFHLFTCLVLEYPEQKWTLKNRIEEAGIDFVFSKPFEHEDLDHVLSLMS